MRRTRDSYENVIATIKSKNMNLGERQIRYESGSVSILYVKQLTDRAMLSELVVRPLVECDKKQGLKAVDVVQSVIYADDCLTDTDESKIEQYILDGMTVVLFSGDTEYIVVNLRKVEKRDTTEPVMTYTIRGPRDALVENLDSNLSLVRYRLKTQSLRIDMLEVGKRTKTAVAVLYLEDVANNTAVSEVKKRIGQIDVDGLSSSGELQAFMLNHKASLFPQMGIIERSDMACGALLEGKVVVLMDGDPWALVAPKVFSEYLWACDDFYLNKYVGTFLRILRVVALNLSFIVSAVYVAIVSFHNDVLPGPYMIAIAQARQRVPFNALIEVILIEIIAELIHESLIRVPSKIGTAIGIVGAIIIGQAAASAGVFSPLLLIVISLSLISSFVPADYTIVDPFRVLKFLLILASGTFGFFGFTVVIVFVVAQLVSINTFGVPYMAPLAPFHAGDFGKSIVYSKSTAPWRAAFLRPKDPTRMPVKKKPRS
jgi:spore germination protein KA/spore germination protein